MTADAVTALPAKQRPIRVLILCTGNSARSILAEGLFNTLGAGRIVAHSAGSRPSGAVNPVALETLARHGIRLPDARSKSWDEFAAPGAPAFDFIFTVCANAAGEACPLWPGQPATAHWGIPDPAHVEPLAARRAAFGDAYLRLERRIRAFLALPLETMTGAEAKAAAQRIHVEMEQ
ncbi:MAG: protein-tyrosine-phosphatase [Betaproteobacteria bacterium HGW-Betaproteobacteria-11]|nr:MAG: protein-tyrosine-phosphatase [Betaproteobacteria bacterium HGW-Betaproteobacteria-11]